MSLRRSARVKSLGPIAEPIRENSLKRAFATTKSGTRKPTAKEPSGTSIVDAPNSTKENGETTKRSVKRETTSKRRKVQPKEPSNITMIKEPTPLPVTYSTGDIDGFMSPSNGARPVEPHITNAPLESPGDRHIATANLNEGLPSAGNVSATISTLLEEGVAHLLRVDDTGRLKAVIDKHHCAVFSPTGLAEVIDPFRSLASGIMAQQVSGAAANSIKNKFIALYPADAAHPGPPHFPPPSLVAQTPLTTLRTAGLSQRKAEYIQGMAEKFVSGELSTEMLLQASDEEVMERLVAVRGLGRWSVEMFACFGLKRMDVFSTGDLGVQRGMAAYMGKDVSKLKAKGGGKWKYMSEKDMLELSAKFAPYRSLFMWYMWRIEDVDVSAVQNA